jgi:hypothetical protein
MAILYYQYATRQERNIELIDSENESKLFFEMPSRIPKAYWKSLLEVSVNSLVPAYGADSFYISYDDIKDTNKSKILLSIKTDKPLTVAGIRLDENENSTATGADNNFHFTTKADVVKEYALTEEDGKGGLFITLLNATGEKVNILDINLTARFQRDDATNLVTDNKMGLQWQDTAETWLDSWYGAGRDCTALTLGGYDDWRLPTYDELIHILDLDGPPYTYEIFEHLGPVGYWTTQRQGVFPDTEVARVVNFGLATWIDISTSQHMNTRCVRTK